MRCPYAWQIGGALLRDPEPEEKPFDPETSLFPAIAFARNPEAQAKTYPFLGVRVWPQVFR